MAKCKKNFKRFDSINVIPFIDIMLVLLVMVLTTTSFIKQGLIPIDLPKALGGKTQELKKELSIYVKANGNIYFEKKKISLKELENKLVKVTKRQNIILKSDKASKFQDFKSIMDILEKLGHEQLYIVTQEE